MGAPRAPRTPDLEGLPSFLSLVGMDSPRLALLLLLVEPKLRGLVLVGSKGSGKSTLLMGAAEGLSDRPPVVLPLGADVEALVGGVDVEATLREGAARFRGGILARAHAGILVADSIHLLPEAAALTLLSALEEGVVRVEREGMSRRLPAEFRLLAAFTPEEGFPRAHLLDRVGLIVSVDEEADERKRAEVLRNHLGRSGGAAEEEAGSLEMVRDLLREARALLPDVQVSDASIRALSRAAGELGVQGHRAETFGIWAARASAALGLRDRVEPEDLELALQWVLRPRATRSPEAAKGGDAPPAPPGADAVAPPPDPPPSSGDSEGADSTSESADVSDAQGGEVVLDPFAVELPLLLDRLPFVHRGRGPSGSRGSRTAERGRQVGSRPGQPGEGPVDLLGTLRAAAPWQRLRADGGTASRVKLRPDDLRIRQHRARAGALFILAVDASGSMALHRMRQAKGAVHALLAQAYIHRDRVALLSFRGDRADLLLRPTQSVELLRRAVDLLPTGGGTPLARALLTALELARTEQARGVRQIALVLLTDGKANVGVRADRAGVAQEVEQIAHAVAEAGIQSLVIDTQRSYHGQDPARNLARALAGQYFHLPGASGEALADEIQRAVRG
jgi:magnesium chelatase subunit D